MEMVIQPRVLIFLFWQVSSVNRLLFIVQVKGTSRVCELKE